MLDSLFNGAKLKGTGEIISLPPAFDMLANLAHAYHIKSSGKGQTDADLAMLFASRALMSSALTQSPASQTAGVIHSCLQSHQNFDRPVRALFQSLLIRFGAGVKAGLASMWDDGQIDCLLSLMEDSASTEKEAARRAMIELTVALGILSPAILTSLQRLSGTVGKSADGRPTITWTSTLISEQNASQNMATKSSQVQDMSGALPYSASTRTDKVEGALKKMFKEMPRTLASVKRPNKHILPMTVTNHPRRQEKPSNPPPYRVPANESGTRTVCGLGRLTFVVMAIIIAALCVAIGILGAYFGAEVRQNNYLEAQLAKFIDGIPTCSTTVTAVTCLSTVTATATANSSTTSASSATTNVASSPGLSSGEIGTVVAGAVFGLVGLLLILWTYVKKRKEIRPGQRLENKPPLTTWQSKETLRGLYSN